MKKKESGGLSGILLPLAVAGLNILIILFPKEIIGASAEGVTLWFNNVFPSLLPFLIGTNILVGMGVTNFIGVLLSPVMYPAFGVSGAGGFALITGMTSGYPMGAKITGMLREKNEITQIEAQRLAAFTNNSGPLFMLGAVGIGMFKNEKIGYFIMLIHYAAALLCGLIFKYYGYNGERRPHERRLMARAYKSMKDYRQKDGRTFGQILGDAVRSAMESTTQIGGFIILFCVIVKALEITGIVSAVYGLLLPAMDYFGVEKKVFEGVFVGIFEMTNGAKILAADGASRLHVLGAAAVISFGGFSIHAQTVSFINKSDIKLSVYILSKLLHSFITVTLGCIIYPFFDFSPKNAAGGAVVDAFAVMADGSVTQKLSFSTYWFMLTLGVVVAAVIVLYLYSRTVKGYPRGYRKI